MNGKYFLSAIAGAVVYFLLGWLFYGILLPDFYAAHTGLTPDVYKAAIRNMDEYNKPALIIGNLFGGFFVATILNWLGVRSLITGFTRMAVIGFLATCMFDLMAYATTNIYGGKAILVDVIVMTVMLSVTGAICGWILGMKKSEEPRPQTA
jgi:VanZ family protein